MSHQLRDALLSQFDVAWALAEHHLTDLTTEECLWRPAPRGLHVVEVGGQWVADWPEHERYELGPSSIAWLGWHLVFWWSMVLDHSFGAGRLRREQVSWPGDAEALRARVSSLRGEWRERLAQMSDEELGRTELTRWPFREQPFSALAGWLNIELAKNVAELGYARFLYAARQ